MVAKIINVKNSGRTACYCLDHDKAKLLTWEGLDIDIKDARMLAKIIDQEERKEFARYMTKSIDASFRLQAGMNTKVEKPVGHIAVSFHPADESLLNDSVMTAIAREYIKMMGLSNTQYMVARHFNPDGKPHFHILYNKVDNDGNRIDDRNNYYKSVSACKRLNGRYQLHLSDEEVRIMIEKFKGEEKAKQACRKVVFSAAKYSKSLAEFVGTLQDEGIGTKLYFDSDTGKPKGISFMYKSDNGHTYSFGGRKLDKSLTFFSIERMIEENSRSFAEKLVCSVATTLTRGIGIIAETSGGSKSESHDLRDDDLPEWAKRKSKGRRM